MDCCSSKMMMLLLAIQRYYYGFLYRSEENWYALSMLSMNLMSMEKVMENHDKNLIAVNQQQQPMKMMRKRNSVDVVG
ncbi:hypothetical protein QR98_0023650 [Sarcoptes scabiei]|uniref:Uncharacterized protein n=1 Tax=Sarcoptes scabiei TaxID=52283 RepID=A0A132A053_SARSC|nr:hypothetical protein QR98_0023650 [Sarcoptes scabiei]